MTQYSVTKYSPRKKNGNKQRQSISRLKYLGFGRIESIVRRIAKEDYEWRF